jgi:S1-C subfamily serine protease
MDFSKAFQKIEGSVVQVLALNANDQISSKGSGVIVGEEGDLVLTCKHCIIEDDKIAIKFSGNNYCQLGEVIFQDDDSDVALLKFKESIGTPVTLKSSSTVLIGQEAFVVGFPLDSDTITALLANIAGFHQKSNLRWIKLNSSVNYGNSGGPLFNALGELIGIVNEKEIGVPSEYLNFVQESSRDSGLLVNGISPIMCIQELIANLQKNLSLGIGYAIPIDHIGSLSDHIENLIQH